MELNNTNRCLFCNRELPGLLICNCEESRNKEWLWNPRIRKVERKIKMGQAEIQKILYGKRFQDVETISKKAKVRKSNVIKSLNKMLKYDEVEKKVIQKQNLNDPRKIPYNISMWRLK